MTEKEINKAESIIKNGTVEAKYLLSKILINNYNKGDISAKNLLNDLSLFDIVKNYSDVCAILKTKELTIDEFSFLPEDQRLKCLNFHKIKNIEKLFNGDWILDWKNRNQEKYFPYFEERGSGLVFDRSACTSYYSYGTVGYFKDRKTSDFVGKIFTEIFTNI